MYQLYRLYLKVCTQLFALPAMFFHSLQQGTRVRHLKLADLPALLLQRNKCALLLNQKNQELGSLFHTYWGSLQLRQQRLAIAFFFPFNYRLPSF